jgi:beta-lactamase class D
MISCTPDFSPNNSWTHTDRSITAQKIQREVIMRLEKKEFPTPSEIYDVVERLVFLVRETKEFLEANREGILKGNP